MSIRSDYDPEYERIKKARRAIEERLGPLWLCQFIMSKTEDHFIRRMKLMGLSEEEMRYALEEYRKIQYSQKKAEEDAKNAELDKQIQNGCVLAALLLIVFIGIPVIILSMIITSQMAQ